MGLFSSPHADHPLSGHASFAWADRKDAKRRAPAAELSAYAAARGLAFHGSADVPGFDPVMPRDPLLRFNAMTGALGGAQGLLFHHLLAWPVDEDGSPAGGGGFFCISYSNRRKMTAGDALFWVPVIGDFVGGNGEYVREPAIGIPATVAAVAVPDLAHVPALRIDNRPKGWLNLGGRVKLKDRGLKGFDLVTDEELDPAFVDRLLTPRLLEVLRGLSDRPYVSLRVEHGMLRLAINGFVTDEALLDQVAASAGALAGELRGAVVQQVAAMG